MTPGRFVYNFTRKPQNPYPGMTWCMLSETEQETPGPRDCDIDCIVMYGGGLTSYEVARRAIERFGHDAVEIWFADTRTEDEDEE